MPELTPIRETRLSLVQRYGEGRFRISGESYTGSVLVTPESVTSIQAETLGDVDTDAVQSALGDGEIDILLVGCGGAIPRLDSDFQSAMKAAGISAEAMDTGAACRTFNVLVTEGRRVAALLIAVD
ncbi:MAG: Mth938-like domain-containing protein [Rhodospirillales bacterium]